MQPELALKAITHMEFLISLVTLLFVLLISLRKDNSGGQPLRCIVHLGLGVFGICTFVALMAAYFQARKMVLPYSNSQRLDTATVSQPAEAT
jgi:hypothetical protein